ncbi:structural maintenance of chromosomes protein [Scheffersomyces xylosifermentans]|uniref:structural maintenance of chromosomes protein n=1 Tax=Scheffersomyces xylosifermentans TaxID=1304137 RepID=UPI00315C9832
MTSIDSLGDFGQYTRQARASTGASSSAKRRKFMPRLSDGDLDDDADSTAIQGKHSNDKYRPGYILKVKVKNFTTYSYAEFNLSPSLNMIIGPNGTGKSTLVAAICLGLGGKIDLIKRKNLKSIIKTGQTRSTVEITLKNFDNKPPVVINREFTESDNRYTINGRTATDSNIKELRKRFNIQLDNLCHFLPQERVAEFAGLTPERLLLETERTLGDGQLLALHEDLIKKDTRSVELGITINDISSKLEKLIQEKDSLEEETKKFKEFEKKTLEIEHHTKLLPYAQLADLKLQQRETKRKRDEAKANLAKFIDSTKPLQNQLRDAQSAREKKQAELDVVDNNQKEIYSRYVNTKKDLASIYDTIDSLKSNINTLRNRSAEKRSELEKLQHAKNTLIRERDRMELPQENEIEELSTLRNEKNDQLNSVNADAETLHDKLNLKHTAIKQVMHHAKSIEQKLRNNDKLVVLEPTSSYRSHVKEVAYSAHQLLRAEPTFKGMYFESPAVCCNATDIAFAPHLEKVIDNNTLLSITTVDEKSFQNLQKFASSKKINFPMRMTKFQREVATLYTQEEVKTFGFEGFLSDFISGPPEVLSMLYDVSKLQEIPVSRRALNREQVTKLTTPNSNGYCPFKKFIAGDTLFVIGRSKYGQKQVFYSTEKIGRSFYFNSSGINAEAKAELSKQLREARDKEEGIKDEIKKLQQLYNDKVTEGKEIKKELDSFKERLAELSITKNQRARVIAKIATTDELIKKITRDSKKDYTEKIRATEEKIETKYKDTSICISTLAKCVSELTKVSIEFNLLEFAVLQAKNREIAAKKLLEDLENRKEALREEYEVLKAEYNKIKKGDAAKMIAEQSKSYTEEERNILSDLAKSYVDAKNFSERVIREKIQLLIDERSVMATADSSSIESLKRKLQEIKTSEKELPRLKSEKSRLDARIEKVRGEWEPALTELVRKISLSFNKRFTKVASDGHVELAKAEKFKDWKLQILVKFRQESELKILDHQSQSGGERAVSTIFFIMSLQGLTDSPFRVVDEINQGMDPKNEKMAHRYLVHTACQNNKSQYFLVTPKLLTGLYYHPDMVVHCIYTGPLIEPVDKEAAVPDFMDFAGKAIST